MAGDCVGGIFAGLISMPGPTIKMNAGDILRILYKNNMTDKDLPETAENTYGYMDHTK